MLMRTAYVHDFQFPVLRNEGVNDFNNVLGIFHSITNRVLGFKDSRVLVNIDFILSHLNP